MKSKLTGFIQLTRFKEYVYFVVATTLYGIAAAGGQFNGRFVIVLVANWLSVGFTFMLNDIEDAPYDAMIENKANRNPIASGLISTNAGRQAAFLVGLVSLILYALLGWKVLIFGLLTLAVGCLYSYRGFRIQTISLLDLASHAWLLAGPLTLTSYYTFAGHSTQKMLFPFLFVICTSLYGELSNEYRTLENDHPAKDHPTILSLGVKATHILIIVLLTVGIISGGITFFIQRIIPLWVLASLMVFFAILILPSIIKLSHSQSPLELHPLHPPFYKPLEKAAAIALLMYYLAPIFLRLFNY
ncbi:MAG: UbiA family prenyltransferase [Anaerolineaceae bacterium]